MDPLLCLYDFRVSVIEPGAELVTNDGNGRVSTWDIAAGSQPLPLIIAHRGDVTNAPENTLAAFRSAYDLGADGIELDVRLTRDGQLIVYHDRCLNRTSNGTGPVNRSTLADIRSLDVGAWFGAQFKGEKALTLDKVFESLPADYLINVEMKAIFKGVRLIAHRVAEVVRRHERWDSTLVASFNPIALWELRKIEPRIMRGYIWSRSHPYPIRSRCFGPFVQAQWYDPANDTYDPKVLHKIRQRGTKMLAWDVDFDSDVGKMALVRLDGAVTDSLEHVLTQRQQLAASSP